MWSKDWWLWRIFNFMLVKSYLAFFEVVAICIHFQEIVPSCEEGSKE